MSVDSAHPAAAANTIQLPRHPALVAPLRRVHFLAPAQWTYIVLVATLLTALVTGFCLQDSPWLALGVWVAIVVALHTALAARVVPWVPGVIALVALVQWVLAPWAGYHVPPPLATLGMAVPATDYFAYAVAATALFALGLYLPLWRIARRAPTRVVPSLPSDFVRTCDLMVLSGVTASLIQSVLDVPFALRYAVVLVEYLAFVGALGLTLARADGWGWRLGGVLLLRALLSTNDGMFQELLLWAAYSFVVLAFVLQWRTRTLVAIAIATTVLLGALNEIKLDYRTQLAESPDLPAGARVEALGHALSNQLEEPLGPFSGRSLSRTVARVNEGWIISRVMYWTPTREPYARGETLRSALWAVLVPRFLDPNKYVAGGSYFTRFTGVPLRGTSMNLSPIGEMYANFGRGGGLIGVFVFALALGLLYGVFARWAMDSPLWWAWAPYVMLYTMQAETGIGEATNHVARSFMVMMVVVWALPAWTSLRRGRRLLELWNALARVRPSGASLARVRRP